MEQLKADISGSEYALDFSFASHFFADKKEKISKKTTFILFSVFIVVLLVVVAVLATQVEKGKIVQLMLFGVKAGRTFMKKKLKSFEIYLLLDMSQNDFVNFRNASTSRGTRSTIKLNF